MANTQNKLYGILEKFYFILLCFGVFFLIFYLIGLLVYYGFRFCVCMSFVCVCFLYVCAIPVLCLCVCVKIFFSCVFSYESEKKGMEFEWWGGKEDWEEMGGIGGTVIRI